MLSQSNDSLPVEGRGNRVGIINLISMVYVAKLWFWGILASKGKALYNLDLEEICEAPRLAGFGKTLPGLLGLGTLR